MSRPRGRELHLQVQRADRCGCGSCAPRAARACVYYLGEYRDCLILTRTCITSSPTRDEFLPLRVHTRYVSIIPIKPYARRAFTSRQHTAQSPGRRTPLVRIRPFALSTPAVGLAVQCRGFGQAFGAWRAKVQGQATRQSAQRVRILFWRPRRRAPVRNWSVPHRHPTLLTHCLLLAQPRLANHLGVRRSL